MKRGLETIIRFPTGRRQRGLVLAMDRGTMRVTFPRYPDVLELRMVSGFWVSENGQAFDVECLIGGCPKPALPAGSIMAGSAKNVTDLKHLS